MGRFAHPARRITLEQGAQVFLDGLRVIEDAAHSLGGIQAATVCLPRKDVKDHRRAALNILLEQLHASAEVDESHRFPIFDAKRRRLAIRVRDEFPAPEPVPHRHRVVGNGEAADIDCAFPFIGDLHFRKYGEDGLLLATNLVAHARLLREEQPVPEALSLELHRSLYILDHAVGGRVRARRTGEAAWT